MEPPMNADERRCILETLPVKHPALDRRVSAFIGG